MKERFDYPIAGEQVARAVVDKQVDCGILICGTGFGARVIGIELAKLIIDTWLSAEFDGGRHQKRLDLIKEIEQRA